MQQQQPGTVTHSRISSLLISRRLTRPRVARDIQFGPRGPTRRASAYEISKSTGFYVGFGFQSGFLDFTFFCDGALGSAFQLYFILNAFT